MLLALLLACWQHPGQGRIVLRNVTWIDVEAADASSARHAGTSVVWEGDRILALGPDQDVAVPEDARAVDGSGRFLVPGWIDMHVLRAGTGDATFSALVARGVTGARDLGGDLAALDRELARIERGELVGPRVARAGLVTEDARWFRAVLEQSRSAGDPGTQLFERTRIPVATEDDALEAVARVVESGADLLKIRNAPPAGALRVLLREAGLAGLRVAAHAPHTIDLVESAELGLGSLEHLPLHSLLDETSPERWREIAAALRAHRVSVTPTFVAMRGRRLDAEELGAAVEAVLAREPGLSSELRTRWREQVDERRHESGELDWSALATRGETLMRDLHAAGVPFLAGTDLGVPLLVPGVGLQEELVALVELAGLTPLEALRAASLDAAAWLGWKDLGALRPGMRVDFVLLESDPLLAIGNVSRVHSVVSRGVLLGPAERARLLEPRPSGDERR